jgi:hypothetical protein
MAGLPSPPTSSKRSFRHDSDDERPSSSLRRFLFFIPLASLGSHWIKVVFEKHVLVSTLEGHDLSDTKMGEYSRIYM